MRPIDIADSNAELVRVLRETFCRCPAIILK
jgi:hypothetical protein